MRKSGLIYPLLLLLSWTGFIVAGNYAVGQATIRQFLAERFPTTRGKIVSSQVGRGPMSRRGVEIEYDYSVASVNYTGHRYRYDDRNEALKWNATVDQYPRWSEHTVFYNPLKPADSVLAPGIDGCDLLELLFAVPLDVTTYILWCMLLGRLREGRSGIAPAGGVRILRQARETRVLLGEMSPLETGFYAMGLATFALAFPVVVIKGFTPSTSLMKIIWAISIGIGVAASVWQWIRNRSGIYDLRVDQDSKTITLPQMAGRRAPVAISQQAIGGVSIQRRSSKSPSGIHFTYLPALHPVGATTGTGPMPLVTWGWSEPKARAFTQWLSQELGVEFKGIEEEKA